MSALHASAAAPQVDRTAPLPGPGRPTAPAAPARPRLRVVRTPAMARTRTPFVLLCMAVLAASLLATLVLNTSMAQGEYERFALQTRLAQSAQAEQELSEELARLAAPQHLTEAATALGMVRTTDGGYLRLSDGAVLGDPHPAQAEVP